MQVTIEAVRRVYLQTTIEADSREEALKIADEYLTEDFEEIGSDFTYTFVN